MKKVRLVLEYDGTSYAGWQLQPNGVAVQQVVETALAKVLGHPVRLVSSGRTDAGVHARGMTVHFTTGRDLPTSAFREGVNRHLPIDIAVRRADFVDADFHARFDARGKWYRYTLHRAEVRSPLHNRTAWHIRHQLDAGAMARAAVSFVGSHDFSAFRSSGCDARTTVREIFAVDLHTDQELLHIDVRGSGFLRNMVRAMIGTLVEVGMGRRPEEDVAQLLRQPCRERAGRTAPPQGLCLMEVWY